MNMEKVVTALSYKKIAEFIRKLYQTAEFIPLHEPRFIGNEKAYVTDCIDSTFVSSVGKYVDRFERMMVDFTGAKYAVAAVNGTAALHIALQLVGVERDDEVVTQPLSFIAACNAISYCGAMPVFVDVDRETLGMSPESLGDFFSAETSNASGRCVNKRTGRRIAAVVPMHTFGQPCRIDEIANICEEFSVSLVEDAAESLGSYYKGRHTGTYGKAGIFSFNGNKTITTGGGGMIVTGDETLAKHAKHITTTAKIAHHYEFVHDEIGYNYRMPNINAALGCAQMESLPRFLESKRAIASAYQQFFSDSNITFVKEPINAVSNYWLNSVILENKQARDSFLEELNSCGIMTRPAWRLMTELPMFLECQARDISNAKWIEERVVNIPSSARIV